MQESPFVAGPLKNAPLSSTSNTKHPQFQETPIQRRHEPHTTGSTMLHTENTTPKTLILSQPHSQKIAYHMPPFTRPGTLIPRQRHRWWGRPDSNRGSRGPKPRIVPSLTTTPARKRTQPAHIKLTNRTSPGYASAQPEPADPHPPISPASHPHRCSRGSSCRTHPSSPPSHPDDHPPPT